MSLVCQQCGDPGPGLRFHDWLEFGLHVQLEHPEAQQVDIRIIAPDYADLLVAEVDTVLTEAKLP